MTSPSKQRPVRLVLGFSSGSASDRIARAIVEPFAQSLGKRVEIELRPGNNGVDAAREVATSPADGGTLFVATLGTHALTPCLVQRLSYDPLADFAPVSLLAQSPMLLACHHSIAADSTRALIALARAHPGKLTYATSAIGGAPHLAAELFQAMAQIEMRHVRYERTEELYRDLEVGRVALSFNNMMSMLPRCRAGTLRALAVSSSQRNPAVPELPTIAEAGLPGYEVTNWLGIVAPKATPETSVKALNAGLCAAVNSEAVLRKFEAAGVSACASTPEEFARYIGAEIERWRPIVARFRRTGA